MPSDGMQAGRTGLGPETECKRAGPLRQPVVNFQAELTTTFQDHKGSLFLHPIWMHKKRLRLNLGLGRVVCQCISPAKGRGRVRTRVAGQRALRPTGWAAGAISAGACDLAGRRPAEESGPKFWWGSNSAQFLRKFRAGRRFPRRLRRDHDRAPPDFFPL